MQGRQVLGGPGLVYVCGYGGESQCFTGRIGLHKPLGSPCTLDRGQRSDHTQTIRRSRTSHSACMELR